MTAVTAPALPACPRCGSFGALEIVYGLPTGEAVEAAERGEIALGGCVIGEESPDYVCRTCREPLPWARPSDTKETSCPRPMPGQRLTDSGSTPASRPARPRYELADARTLRGSDGTEFDVMEAIAALPWTPQLCPFMRHEYAITNKSPPWAWYALEAMIRLHPDSYRAYFRGYPSVNRYSEAPDGLRYWRGRFEINRATPESVSRRAASTRAPSRSRTGTARRGLRADWASTSRTGRASGGGFEGTDMQPCRACRNPPREVTRIGAH